MHDDQAASTGGPLIGSLCSGYGGLDLGVQAALGGTLACHAETDPGAARILTRHWPGTPNLGDITTVNWADVPGICVLTAGFPCQRCLRGRTPCRSAGRKPLGPVAPHRHGHRRPRPLPGGDRKRTRHPHLTRRDPWRPRTLSVVCGRPRRPSLLCAHSGPYSDPWPTSGVMHAGACYAPPTSEPHTEGNGSSSPPGDATPLLKTPTNYLASNGGASTRRNDATADTARTWPTKSSGSCRTNARAPAPGPPRRRANNASPCRRSQGRSRCRGSSTARRRTGALRALGGTTPRPSPDGRGSPARHRRRPITRVVSLHGSWNGCRAASMTAG